MSFCFKSRISTKEFVIYINFILATQLALYLADSLDSNSFKIKPAKSIHHLVRKGSRQFRKTLRTQKDDVLRKFANSSDPLVAKLCQEIRNNLFDEALMAEDESESIDQKPTPRLSGMGSSLSTGLNFAERKKLSNIPNLVFSFILQILEDSAIRPFPKKILVIKYWI